MQADAQDAPMLLTEHLAELRRRLTISIVAIVIGFAICYGQAEFLFGLLLRPIEDVLQERAGHMIFTGLAEPFIVYIKTGLLGGLLLAMPVIFWQIWLFVRPAFRGSEEKYTTAFVIAGSLLFVTGALFGYFLVFPYGFRFLLLLGGDDYQPLLTLREYFSLATRMLLAFGAMFETPMVLVFLARLGAIDAAWLRRNRRYAIVVTFIVAAILTPPDVFSQSMLALPMLALYEISVWLVAAMGKKKADAAAA